MPVTDAHLASFRDHGFAIIDQLLGPEELKRAREDLRRYCPEWEELQRAPELYPHISELGSAYLVNGPFVGSGLNAVSTHPELLRFARAVIGTDEILMEQSHLRAEYFGVAEYEQHFHLDFGSHSLTYPRDDGTFQIISCIVYYTDVTEEHGPTHVVSRQVTRRCFEDPFAGRTGAGRSPFGGSNLRWQLTPEEFPEVYAEQVPVLVPAGGALIFAMGTWHRAGRFTGPGARLSHTVSFRAAAHDWAGFEGWSYHGPEPGMQHFLVHASPEERELLGFPAPGHPYWNEETIRGVAARYPGMDMTPYRRALAAR